MDKDLLIALVGGTIMLVAALCGLIILFFRTALDKIWGELKSLRKVRHDDTDAVTEVHGKMTVLEYTVKDIKQELRQVVAQVAEILETNRRNRRYKDDR